MGYAFGIWKAEAVCSVSTRLCFVVMTIATTALKRMIGGHRGPISAIDPHPFGDYFAFATVDGKFEVIASTLPSRARLTFHVKQIWNTRSRTKVATYPGNGCAITVLKHSPDGHCIAAGDASGRIKV